MKKNRNTSKFYVNRFVPLIRLATLICLTALILSGCGGSESRSQNQTADKSASEVQSDNENIIQGNKANTSQSEDLGGDTKADKSESIEISYEQISQEEAKNLIDTETDVIILDVRTEEEYAGGHIAGAICIPNETIDDSVTEQLPDKEQLILVYCRSGNRSKQASEKLVNLGYSNIKEFGGINTWQYDIEQ